MKSILALAAILILFGPFVPASPAASFGEWRCWQAEQGLADSFIHAISRDVTGAIWAVHGDVSGISRYDGRGFTIVKSPPMFRAFDSLGGLTGWVADVGGLHNLYDGKWDSFPETGIAVPTYSHQLRALDLGNRQALLLYPDRLARISAQSRRIERLPLPPANSRLGPLVTFVARTVLPSATGVWVVAERGLAHLSYTASGNAPYIWKEYPLGNLPVSELRSAIESVNGDVFASGIQAGANRRVALRLVRGKWEVIAVRPETGQQLLAWRDGIGDLWLADGDVLMRKAAADFDGIWKEVDQHDEVLSGLVQQALVNPDGSFFLATTRGLALHVNPAWKVFGRTLDSHAKPIKLRQHIGSLIEDRKRRLWFLGPQSLFRLQGEQWDEYPVPRGFKFDLNQPNVLGELPDGRILVQPEVPAVLGIFDPEKLVFTSIALPDGYRSLIHWRRPDGRFRLAMVAAGDVPDAFADVDGDSLSRPESIHAKWALNFARGAHEDSQGRLWLGGTSGLWLLEHGTYERLQLPRGAASPGPMARPRPASAFAILEEAQGRILIGGRDGLYRWTGSRLEVEELGIEAARRLIRDRSGTVWVASGKGVFRSLLRQSRRDWFPNDVSDGLPSTVAQSALEDSQGRIWIATNKGPAIYLPRVDQDAPETTIRADQNSREAAPDGRFQIIFSGKDKWENTPDHRLLFSYRLDGGEWSAFSKSTLAAFQSLPAGKHRFEAVALDSQGNVSSSSARLDFTAFERWYRTSTFLQLMTLVTFTIAYLAWLTIRHYHERGKLIVQLSAAGEAAAAANRSKSEFLANMSHEIRTPMNGVIGMTDLALALEISPDVKECLETVKVSGQALLTVINDILDFSKIEAGNMELDPAPFRLRDCLGDALRTIAVPAQEKGLELACEVGEDVPDALIGDMGRLRQIVLNLAGNAIKFTSSGEVVLRVGLDLIEGENARLQFYVRDTGIGIPLEKRQFVFDSFSQADGSTSRRYGGTGLGLTISKRLAAMMDGHIWLESEVGKGTTVYFTAQFQIEHSVAGHTRVAPASLRGIEVLVVDDSQTNRGILRQLLTLWQMNVTLAESGWAALTLLEQRSFDLLLLDVQMPGMDGFEALEVIRRRWPDTSMKIALLTSVGHRGTVQADAYLCKPVKSSDLLQATSRLFAEGPEPSKTRAPAPRRETPALDILLAEDNPVNQKLVLRVLENAGHRVTVTPDGRQAVAALDAGSFDLILMDVQMPEMDGFEATGAIRRRELATGRSRIPIIALTAHAMAGDRERCLLAGMDGYATKPIQPDELLDEIALAHATRANLAV